MARNKTLKPLTESPPEPESSSDQMSGSSTEAEDADTAEQEVSSASSSSAEEEEEEQTPSVQTTPPPPFSSPSKKSTTLKKPTPQPDYSSSEESESNEEEENDPPVAKLKPTSKPVTEPPSSFKPRSKPTDKRPVESEKEKPPSKRIKKDNTKPPVSSPVPGPSPGPNEEGSKKLFQRVFSEEDEVEILKGMIDFKDRSGGDPMKNDDEFYGLVKKKLHAEVNKAQVVDKVKRLKRKFNNAKKSKKKIVNDHEKKLFELSNRIWEVNEDEGDSRVNGNNNGGVVATPTKAVKEKDNVSGKSGLKDRSLKGDNGAVEEKKKSKEEGNEVDEIDEGFKIGEGEVKEVMRAEALKLIGEKGRAEIREMWRKVEIAQLEADLMRNEARVKENRMVMEALGLGKR